MTQETEARRVLAEQQVGALIALASHNIPPDMQEVLVQGNPLRGIKPGALSAALSTARAEGIKEGLRMAAEVARAKAATIEAGTLPGWMVSRARADAYRTAATAIEALAPGEGEGR